MSSAPAISVITPVWNGLPYVKQCIDSVLAQEFQDWEHLIGDNGSTDGTRDYLAGLTDPRIHVYMHEKNLGISGNLNFLLAKANAPLAYILCADDFFLPNGLTYALDEWRSSKPGVALICFRPDPGKSLVNQYAYAILPKIIGPSISPLAFFLFGNFTGNLSNVSVSVPAFNSTGGFAERLKTAQDFEMWRELASKANIILTDRKVVYIREHEGSATHYLTKKGDNYIQLITIYEILIKELSKENDYNDLVTYFNMQICPQYYRTGIKYALYGKFTYFKTVATAKSPILWDTWKQLLICVPLAIVQNLREYLIVRRAKSLMNRSTRKLAMIGSFQVFWQDLSYF